MKWVNEFDEYQQLAERTAKRDGFAQADRYSNFSMGLAGEAGEVCDHLKKVLYHGHALDEFALRKELGDVLWYLTTIATTAGFRLSDIAAANIAKLQGRYPEGFDEDRSRNRERETPIIGTYTTCQKCGRIIERDDIGMCFKCERAYGCDAD